MAPMEWLAELQGLDPVLALKRSRWVYPLVNAGHLVGISLLFGAIASLDLRLLGCWRSVPPAGLARVLQPVALAGFLLAAACGFLLFSVGATHYAGQPLFLAKMLLIALALLNALLLRRSRAWQEMEAGRSEDLPARLRLGALASLVLWAAVILCGRFLGYL